MLRKNSFIVNQNGSYYYKYVKNNFKLLVTIFKNFWVFKSFCMIKKLKSYQDYF